MNARGLYPGCAKAELEEALRNPTKYYLMPVWLEDAFEAHHLNKQTLADNKKLNSILTVDDVKFYNGQVYPAMEMLRRFQILDKDICFSPIIKDTDLIVEPLESSLYEENTSFTDVIAPFIKKESGCSVTEAGILPYSVYPSFEIFTELNLVCVTLKVADTSEIKDLVAKENEKYVSFMINQYGLKSVACTDAFKNVINI